MPNFRSKKIDPSTGASLMSKTYGFQGILLNPVSGPHVPKPAPVLYGDVSGEEIPELDVSTALDKVKSQFAVALLDTGIAKDHPFFDHSRIVMTTSGENKEDVWDLHGHGTHLAGLIAGKGPINGMYPRAPLVSIKVTSDDSGETYWSRIVKALQMVIDSRKNPSNKFPFPISVVNLSFNSFDRLKMNEGGLHFTLYEKIQQLEEDFNVPVVVSAGNYFDLFQQSDQSGAKYGLAFPAHYREVIAVGSGGQSDNVTAEILLDRQELAPYSQRALNNHNSSDTNTFINAPGMCTVSAGIPYRIADGSDRFISVLSGTSASAAIVTGVILIMQELWSGRNNSPGVLPPVSFIRQELSRICDKLDNKATSAFANGFHQHWKRFLFDDQKYLYLNTKNL